MNSDVAQQGAFNVQNRKINFGFELTNKFYLHNDYFIKTGLRYSSLKTSISAGDGTSTVIEAPYLLYWTIGYQSITLPILFGKDFVSAKGKRGDVFAGVSVGMLMLSTAGTGLYSGPSNSTAAPDTLTSRTQDFSQAPSSFLATADFGASYQFFKSAPRFTIGLMCSIQLTPTKAYPFQGTVSDSRGNSVTYDIQHKQQFTNCAVSFNYTFGKLKHVAKTSDMLPQTN